MKCLIIEEDFSCRRALQVLLSDYAECFVACNEYEGVRSFVEALETDEPYDLIFLDITMRSSNGNSILATLRRIESEREGIDSDGVKVIIIAAVDEAEDILWLFRTGREGFVFKPVERTMLLNEMHKLGFLDGIHCLAS